MQWSTKAPGSEQGIVAHVTIAIMEGCLTAATFAPLEWLEHGFGTRHAVIELYSLKQIHSDRVLIADRPGLLGEGDALVTNRPGLAISIRTADCYPILLADAKNRAV